MFNKIKNKNIRRYIEIILSVYTNCLECRFAIITKSLLMYTHANHLLTTCITTHFSKNNDVAFFSVQVHIINNNLMTFFKSLDGFLNLASHGNARIYIYILHRLTESSVNVSGAFFLFCLLGLSVHQTTSVLPFTSNYYYRSR